MLFSELKAHMGQVDGQTEGWAGPIMWPIGITIDHIIKTREIYISDNNKYDKWRSVLLTDSTGCQWPV